MSDYCTIREGHTKVLFCPMIFNAVRNAARSLFKVLRISHGDQTLDLCLVVDMEHPLTGSFQFTKIYLCYWRNNKTGKSEGKHQQAFLCTHWDVAKLSRPGPAFTVWRNC